MKLETLCDSGRKPKYSVFSPFTRPWMVEKWFDNFYKMDIDRGNSELILYVDTDDKAMLSNITKRVKDQWAKVKVYFSGLKPPRETRDPTRRSRHVLMRSTSQNLLGKTEYLLGLEDDTLPPKDAFPKLLRTIKSNGIGFVQGTEMDRWGIGCLGAFKLQWDGTQFIYAESLPYRDTGLMEIDGGGHYCFMMPTQLYKDIPFMRPGGLLTNIDLYHIYRIKQKGFKVLTDYSIKCFHCTQDKMLYPKPDNVPILKRWVRGGKVEQTISRPGDGGGKMEVKNLVSVEFLGPCYENYKKFKKGDRTIMSRKRANQLGRSVKILHEIHDPVVKQFVAPVNTMAGAPITKKSPKRTQIPMYETTAPAAPKKEEPKEEEKAAIETLPVGWDTLNSAKIRGLATSLGVENADDKNAFPNKQAVKEAIWKLVEEGKVAEAKDE